MNRKEGHNSGSNRLRLNSALCCRKAQFLLVGCTPAAIRCMPPENVTLNSPCSVDLGYPWKKTFLFYSLPPVPPSLSVLVLSGIRGAGTRAWHSCLPCRDSE